MMDASGSAPSLWRRVWKVGRIVLVVILLLYIGLVIYRIPAVHEKYVSDQTVKQIQATKLTMESVDGKHLPPPPDPKEADATLVGIDANQNGIRDDVELAIFKKYPSDIKLRAAELQYALALQMYLMDVFTIDTLTAVSWQESRGFLCIDKTLPPLPSNASNQDWDNSNKLFVSKISEVTQLVFNTAARKNKKEEVYKNFMSSHLSPSSDFCDIDFSS